MKEFQHRTGTQITEKYGNQKNPHIFTQCHIPRCSLFTGLQFDNTKAQKYSDNNNKIKHVFATNQSPDQLIRTSGYGQPIRDVPDQINALPHTANKIQGRQQSQRTNSGNHLIRGQAGHEQPDRSVSAYQQVYPQQSRKD